MSAKKTRDPIVCFSAVIKQETDTVEALYEMVSQFLKEAKALGATDTRYYMSCIGPTDKWGQETRITKLIAYK